MKWSVSLLLLSVVCSSTVSYADGLKGEAAYKASVHHAEEILRSSLISAKKQYVEELQRQLSGATKAGDLTLANRVSQEKGSVQDELKELEAAASADAGRHGFITVKSAQYGGEVGGTKNFVDVRPTLKMTNSGTLSITVDDYHLANGRDLAPGGGKSLLLRLNCNSIDVGIRVSAPCVIDIFRPEPESHR